MGVDNEPGKKSKKKVLSGSHTRVKRKQRAKDIRDSKRTRKQEVVSVFQSKASPHHKPQRDASGKRIAVNKDTRRAKRELLENTWLNSGWRKRWRGRWGKNKWKLELKSKWDSNPHWRRKWMKRLRENWWNIKWRRKWQEQFLTDKWLRKFSKERRKRKKFWRRKWRKSGYKRMGLSFNEYLITQRRVRFLKNNPPEVVNWRRKEKRLLKEGRLTRKAVHPQVRFSRTRRKPGRTWNKRLKYAKERWKAKLSKNFHLRPAIIQFKFYLFNAFHGILAFLFALSLYLKHEEFMPDEFAMAGFFVLLFYGPSMDVFGSIFGIITSNYLNSLYDPRRGERPGKRGCFGLCGSKAPEAFQTNEKEKNDKERSKIDNQFNKYDSKKRVSEKRSKESVRKKSRSAYPVKDHDSSRIIKSPKDKIASCIRSCFACNRSMGFVDRMGCASYVFFQMAWFFNLYFTGYFSWVKRFSKRYEFAMKKCDILPKERYCYEFEQLYYYGEMLVISSFLLRSFFLFITGMCISERYLKRCQTFDPKEELPSTCSDTDVDFNKVPKQILIPYLLSDGRSYPYILPESCRPPDERTRRRKKRARKTNSFYSKTRHGRAKHRVLSAQEKEASKIIQSFKGIREVSVPLPTGRRQPFKLPPVSGFPDTIQLPPELMTMEARAWLSEEETDSSEAEHQGHGSKMKVKQPKHLARKRRASKVREAHSLLVLHGTDSRSKLDIEQLIQPKVNELDSMSDRLSTDESWENGPDSLFDSCSEHITEEEVIDKKKSQEDIMAMMIYNELDDDPNAGDGANILF